MAPSHKRVRRVTKPATETSAEEFGSQKQEFDDVFLSGYDSDSSMGSDVSEYGKRGRARSAHQKKRRARKSTVIRPGPGPEAPAMSAEEAEEGPGDDSLQFGDGTVMHNTRPTRKATATSSRRSLATPVNNNGKVNKQSLTPKMVQIQLDVGTGAGGTVINLDLASLLQGTSMSLPVGGGSFATPGDDTWTASPSVLIVDHPNSLTNHETSQQPSQRRRMLQEARHRNELAQQKKKGFKNLPFELRVRIYRQVFVTEAPIDFASRENFDRSSAFLRTCRMVYDEGTQVLYAENAFHFERSTRQRGLFFESAWKEIGFKDVRRFLHVIGAQNISKMRYVSFHLQDAAPSATPGLDEDERRFVNDPVLHHVLQAIGAHAHLAKFAFALSGRRMIVKQDYHFLKALATIKAEEVIHADRISCFLSSKVRPGIVPKLKKLMTLPREDGDEIDEGKKKAPLVKMFYERPPVSTWYGAW